MQDIAQDCINLLRAIADAFSDRSVDIARALHQQQQLADSEQQAVHLFKSAIELYQISCQLSSAATSLLLLIQESEVCSVVDERQLLDTLGQLVRRVSQRQQNFDYVYVCQCFFKSR